MRATSQCPIAQSLLLRFQSIRGFSEFLASPLLPEDTVIQSMPDCSPTRWHLAHTTWFFETFVLARAFEGYKPFDPVFGYLFNSYYNSVGEQFPREERGLMSRPDLAEVLRYRRHVDGRVEDFLSGESARELLPVVELGLNHEQQHQELILTDIKHAFSCNPIYPVYREALRKPVACAAPLSWIGVPEGVYWIGHDAEGFAFDNESPRHRCFLESFSLASRLSTSGEYIEFIEAGGYQRPEFWLSAGWQQVQEKNWLAPLYWVKRHDGWRHFTLSGLQPVTPEDPVCHVSYFEADAFAHWSGARLPTEAEWEVASEQAPVEGNFVENGILRPVAATQGAELAELTQMFGDVWQWTSSSYAPYPGYKPVEGALGEYNGKFMCNQYVLRGGSCATPGSHIRRTYRNFFAPDARWQFSGIRLARS